MKCKNCNTCGKLLATEMAGCRIIYICEIFGKIFLNEKCESHSNKEEELNDRQNIHKS